MRSRYVIVMILYHLVSFLLSAYLVVASEYDYTVIVPARKTECYGFTIADEKYQSFDIHFQVITGGARDITFSITSSKGLRLINDLKHTDGSHRIDLNLTSAGYGDYLFCFDNAFSIKSNKHVFFELYVFDADGRFVEDFNKPVKVGTEVLRTLNMHIESFQKLTTNVKNNLNTIERLQKQHAIIELADRSAIERSFEMINFWSVFHLFVMLFALFVQVYMVRSLFEENTRIGLILRKGFLNN